MTNIVTGASTPRRERVLRLVGLFALGGALVLSVSLRWLRSDGTGASRTLRVDASRSDPADRLAREVAARIVDAVSVSASSASSASSGTVRRGVIVEATFTVVPDGASRSALGAAVDAGVSLAWRDSTHVHAMAFDVTSRKTAQPASMLSASGAMDSTNGAPALVLRDGGGVLDSMAGATPLLQLSATRVQPPIRAQLLRAGVVVATANAPVPAPPRVRSVLLYAQPGWDAKFVGAALEESGWVVEGSLTISPRARVKLGTPTLPDTARYSAVVVLDSGLVSARTLTRFVSQGGGVVIAGDAVRDPTFAPLTSTRIASERPVLAGALLTDQPRRGLSAYRLVERASGSSTAVVLERDGTAALVIAVRRGPGRVLTSGYRATWRWRMEGSDESADDHRRWWNMILGAVAFAPDTSTGATVRAPASASTAGLPGDAAPKADLIARLGPSVSTVAASPPFTVSSSRALPPLWLLFVIAMLAFLAEWSLRRMRGVS